MREIHAQRQITASSCNLLQLAATGCKKLQVWAPTHPEQIGRCHPEQIGQGPLRGLRCGLQRPTKWFDWV
jgi:hypothetical protein